MRDVLNLGLRNQENTPPPQKIKSNPKWETNSIISTVYTLES